MLWLFACAGPPSAERFEDLHRDVYSAYGLSAEALHPHLARSFSGPELTDRYLEWWAVLEANERDEVRVEVMDVEYVSVLVADEGLNAQWTVQARVHHGEHEHVRTNRYAAWFRLEDRIVESRMQDMERLDLEEDAGRKPLQELF
mgnify:CR=1 FL=1